MDYRPHRDIRVYHKIPIEKKVSYVENEIFIRLRLNTLQLVAVMKGKVNRAEARQSVGGLGYGAIPL